VNTTTRPRLGYPALVGGLVTGVLSALPIVYLGNLCCCLWVISGGVVAAYVLQQEQSSPITPGDGALVGLLAGLAGAVIQTVVSIPISLMFGPMERAIVQRVLDTAGSMPPEVRDALDQYVHGGVFGNSVLFIAGRFVELFVALVLGSIFSTIGGLIGAAIFRKPIKPTEPGALDVNPPTA
jgi:hypothetical protein